VDRILVYSRTLDGRKTDTKHPGRTVGRLKIEGNYVTARGLALCPQLPFVECRFDSPTMSSSTDETSVPMGYSQLRETTETTVGWYDPELRSRLTADVLAFFSDYCHLVGDALLKHLHAIISSCAV
jgi:hypothetical protein